MIILDNAPLLTWEVPIDHGASEILFLLLQLTHGSRPDWKQNPLKVLF